jgi:hypothetical protein
MDDVVASVASEETAVYLGRWQRLVSTTNWEKGKILAEWRADLEVRGAAASDYSDETWSRQVGNVSPQHVGRLRRVWERFGDVRETYQGLFWSHFQAALDWDDAELWLEGAMQSRWSISQMRTQRAESLGQVAEPSEEVAAEEYDADGGEADSQARSLDAPFAEAFDPAAEYLADDGETAEESDDDSSESESSSSAAASGEAAPPVARPFAHLPSLPDDLDQAIESVKLAILRHKLGGWRDVAGDDIAAHLDALRSLALTPSDV